MTAKEAYSFFEKPVKFVRAGPSYNEYPKPGIYILVGITQSLRRIRGEKKLEVWVTIQGDEERVSYIVEAKNITAPTEEETQSFLNEEKTVNVLQSEEYDRIRKIHEENKKRILAACEAVSKGV